MYSVFSSLFLILLASCTKIIYNYSMIYHVFYGNVVHHVPNMMSSILEYSDFTNSKGKEEHFFVIRFKDKPKSDLISIYKKVLKNKNVSEQYKFFHNDLKFFIFLLTYRLTNKIIFHSFQSLFKRPLLFWMLLLFMSVKRKKRMVQVVWGLPLNIKKPKPIKKRMGFIIRNKVIRHFDKVVVLSNEDKEKAEKYYQSNNITIAKYISETYSRDFHAGKQQYFNIRKTRIMVSHSAFEHNEHLETFCLLHNFAEKDFQILCPLSYGDKEYKNRLVESGKKLFGNKFTYIEDLLPGEQYNQMLSEINVYISSAKIQTGLHVVYFCLGHGIKLFLNQNNYNWVSDLGFQVNHVNEIKSISFNELIEPLSQSISEHNKNKFAEIFNIEKIAEPWKNIYK